MILVVGGGLSYGVVLTNPLRSASHYTFTSALTPGDLRWARWFTRNRQSERFDPPVSLMGTEGDERCKTLLFSRSPAQRSFSAPAAGAPVLATVSTRMDSSLTAVDCGGHKLARLEAK